MTSIISTLLVLGIIGYAIIHRCDLLGLCGGGSTTNTVKPPPATQITPIPSQTPIPITNSGGTCGSTIYKTTGKTIATKDNGLGGQTIHYASSGKAASSRRLDTGSVGFSSIEATIYFQFNGTNCGKPDPEMSIKFWGPPHSGSACCYCIAVVTASGKVCFGGEGPHPSTTTCQQNLGNVGSLKGKTIGMKFVIWPGSGGAHQELYLDIGNGQWKLMGTRDGPCGKDKKSTTPAPNHQVEYRIDCKNVTIQCSSVVEIVPGSKATTAKLARIAYI